MSAQGAGVRSKWNRERLVLELEDPYLGQSLARLAENGRPTPEKPHVGSRIRIIEPFTLHVPLQHLHLVPEHEKLDLPPLVRASSGSEDAADEEVHQREQHGAPFGSRGGACY